MGRLAAAALALALDDDRETGLTNLSWYRAGPPSRGYYLGDHVGFHTFVYWDAQRRVTAVMTSNCCLEASLKPQLARALVALASGAPATAMPAPRAAEAAYYVPGVDATVLFRRGAGGAPVLTWLTSLEDEEAVREPG